MRKINWTKYEYISLILIIVFFASMIIYLITITPGIDGDGGEYIMQTVAFQNHLSFGINEDDLEMTKEQFYNHQESIQIYYDRLIRDDRNWAYSNHYGAYSAIVAVIKMVLMKMGVYPLWAFSITNLLLWMAAILVIFFCLKTDGKRKFCIIFLLIFNPIFYYLDWTHTEIYIFAFEVIGLVFLYNKKYALSILAFSVSAMQNLGVLPMAAVAGIAYILECYDKYVQEKQEKNVWCFIVFYWKRIVPYGVFYIPAFLPMITTYIRFGTFNLVAKVAMENKYLLHKAIGYLMDPNLGIFPYEPIILITFIALVIIGMRKFPREAILNLVGVAGILYVIAHQIQINCGMQGIMRYCVWIIPIMIFFVVLKWKPFKQGNGLLIVSIVEGVFTATVISYCTWFGGAYGYCQFANWTKTLMDIAPQVYNPTHGIFLSRTEGIELYDSNMPVIYENDEGYVRKILVKKDEEKLFYDGLLGLIDENGVLIDLTTGKRREVDEGDYVYYNFTGKIKCIPAQPLDTIWFYTDEYNADIYVKEGLSDKEDWGTWTNGKKLKMEMQVDTDAPFINVLIDVGSVFYHPQSITAIVNETEVYQGTVTGAQGISFTFENPETHIVELTILLPDAVAPSEVMDSNDPRVLGLGLLKMTVSEAVKQTG